MNESQKVICDFTNELVDTIVSTQTKYNLQQILDQQFSQFHIFTQKAIFLLNQVKQIQQLENNLLTFSNLQDIKFIQNDTIIQCSHKYQGIIISNGSDKENVPDQTWAGCQQKSFEIRSNLPIFLLRAIFVIDEDELLLNLKLIKKQEFVYKKLLKFVIQADIYWLKKYFK